MHRSLSTMLLEGEADILHALEYAVTVISAGMGQ